MFDIYDYCIDKIDKIIDLCDVTSFKTLKNQYGIDVKGCSDFNDAKNFAIRFHLDLLRVVLKQQKHYEDPVDIELPFNCPADFPEDDPDAFADAFDPEDFYDDCVIHLDNRGANS